MATKIISYNEYCERVNAQFIRRLEIHENAVLEGRLSEHKYILIADLMKQEREGALLHFFYLFRVEQRHRMVLATAN